MKSEDAGAKPAFLRLRVACVFALNLALMLAPPAVAILALINDGR